MNRKTLLITIGLGLVLIALAFLTGKAVASTGCFTDTNGNWAEIYICWLYDNGISSGYGDGTYRPGNYVTRAEMSKFLRLQAEVPPTSGLIAISEGFTNWMPFSTSTPVGFTYYTNLTRVNTSSLGSFYISVHPSLPVVLYGNSLQLIGVEFCFNASEYAYLEYFMINVPAHTSQPGNTSPVYTDDIDRTAPACRYYTLPAPVTLSVDNEVNIYAQVTWTNTSNYFDVGRTTFILQPTSTKATLPSSLENMTVLSEAALGMDVPFTNP